MNVEVTSVSKKEQKLSQTAAAIHVITQEDIPTIRLTSIPELLRMVPVFTLRALTATNGLSARAASTVALRTRCWYSSTAGSVYTPLFSGVYWDIQDVMLEDVERIEVIRGPGPHCGAPTR
jgi:iron complex outermembrane receptor protein